MLFLLRRAFPSRGSLFALAALVAVAAAAMPVPAAAMGPTPDDPPAKADDPDLERAVGLIWVEEYAEAEPLLRASLKRDPANADAWNYLGFVSRKLENFDEARQAYFNALRLDPGHLKAMEYLGELYLQTGEPEQARELLERMAPLCGAVCEERDTLAAAIAAHGAGD